MKFFSILFFGSILIIYLSSFFIEKIYINYSFQSLKDFTEKTIKKLDSKMDRDLEKLLFTLSEINNMRISLIKEDGEILYDSHSNPKNMENHKDREEFINSIKYGEGTSVRISHTLNTKMIYYAKKVSLNNKTFVFRSSKEISTIKEFIKPYKSQIIIFFSLSLLIILSLMFLYFRNVTKKIASLQSQITRISKGDFDSVISTDKKDVFYSITQNINFLAQSIKKLTDDIKNQKELLSNILENLPFPVVIINENNDFLVESKYFRDFFPDIKNIEELANLIRDENLYQALNFYEKEKKDFTVAINFNNRYFTLFGDKIIYHDKPILLLTFIDITEIKKTEKMKADFTANVSHELKTPITVLKGYIETLEDELPSDKYPIIKIMKRHIERLSNLVSDVLLLSRLDAKVPLEKEYFNLKELITNAVETFNNDIKEKNINFKILVDDDIFYYGDNFLIFQAIINLVSNAVKYTSYNGLIEIKSTLQKDIIILTIKDTGPGIPKEYHEKIFQRFFVIDKSRSRQLGGTGLGLSIVKHIIELHNGRIDVESELGKGTTFIITLPLLHT